MDGASKFVRGDVIAGLLITFINIIGGLIIGTLQLRMPIGEAAATYTLMTIGDGLVSQIPALLISTASGMIVSRAASENLSNELTRSTPWKPKNSSYSWYICIFPRYDARITRCPILGYCRFPILYGF